MKVFTLVLLSLILAHTTFAAEEGESVDVSKITEKYWAQGKETELGVVQNRKYTSAGRWELEVMGGIMSSDPFLSVHHLGLEIGYHFDQYVSVHVLGWRTAAVGSAALTSFQNYTASKNFSATVDTNMPQYFYGAQVDYNFLYGKASLFGHAIIYVDLFFLGGVGVMSTESGNDIAPFGGLGMRINLSKYMALDFDYRFMLYNETILGKNANNVGQVQGSRTNSTDAVSLGVSFFY